MQVTRGPVIGSGAYATVHAVAAPPDTCVKRARFDDPQLGSTHLRELTALARLQGSAVVPAVRAAWVHRRGSSGYSFDILMERGACTLLDVVNYYRAEVPRGIPLLAAMDLVAALFLLVAQVHDRGMLHRDIKPSNVVVQRDGSLRLIDFGLSRVDAAPALEQLPMSLYVVSRAFRPPELLRELERDPSRVLDDCGYGEELDVWAAAVTALFLLGSRYAFQGATCAAVLASIEDFYGGASPARAVERYLHETCGVPLARDLCAALGRALERDPARRGCALDVSMAFGGGRGRAHASALTRVVDELARVAPAPDPRAAVVETVPFPITLERPARPSGLPLHQHNVREAQAWSRALLSVARYALSAQNASVALHAAQAAVILGQQDPSFALLCGREHLLVDLVAKVLRGDVEAPTSDERRLRFELDALRALGGHLIAEPAWSAQAPAELWAYLRALGVAPQWAMRGLVRDIPPRLICAEQAPWDAAWEALRSESSCP